MQISDSEKIIMDILWDKSPQNAKSIIENIDDEHDWQDKTVKTLINRLLKKQAIGFEKQGREYLYYPLLARADYIEEASSSFLNKVFNGNLTSLVASFAKQQKISDQELNELKSLINNLENKE